MKKQNYLSGAIGSFYIMILVCFQSELTAQHVHQHDEPEHVCQLHDLLGPTELLAPSESSFETAASPAGAPSVSISFSQLEGSTLLYETVGGWNGSEARKAQLSLRIWVKNLGNQQIKWDKVSFSYLQNGSLLTKTFFVGMMSIAPNENKSWQNSRDYHEVGDVIYLDSPLPTSLTLKLYFFGYSTPVTIIKPLGPYNKTYGMPFRAYDLSENEVWEGGSTHGGGSQVFAYDLGVKGYSNGVWSSLLPGKDDSENENFRVWGKPIYAMADGVIAEYVNNCPGNPTPGSSSEATWGPYKNGAAGNHFYIKHGDNIALYAHMQKGSLNSKLLTVGATVKAGEFLGLVGNSGNSTGPHLHIHTYKESTPESGPFRPLLFNTGWVIEKGAFPTPKSGANWFELTAHGIPGKGTTRAFIWPSKAKPFYDDKMYAGVWQSSASSGHALMVGVSKPNFPALDNAYQAQGLRIQDLSVVNDNGTITYSGVWRPGNGVSKIEYGTTAALFKLAYSNLELQNYRLLDVEVFRDGNSLKYAGVFGAGNYLQKFHTDMAWNDFKNKDDAYSLQGYHLSDLETYKNNNSYFYTAVWRKVGSGDNPVIKADTWNSFTSQWSAKVNQGYRLVDLDTEEILGGTFYVGVFVKSTAGHYLWESNWNSFVAKWEDLSKTDLRLCDFNVRMKAGANMISGDVTIEEVSSEEDVFESRSKKEKSTGLGIYPNPATDQFTLKTESNIIAWDLYNCFGQNVMNEKPDELSTERQIRTDGLVTGRYFMHVQTEEGIVTKQIEIIQRQ